MSKTAELSAQNTALRVGDRIRLAFNHGYTEDYTIEEFRQCLGIFKSCEDRKAQNFTPLCQMYGAAPNAKEIYIPNYGGVYDTYVPVWMNLPREAADNKSLYTQLGEILEQICKLQEAVCLIYPALKEKYPHSRHHDIIKREHSGLHKLKVAYLCLHNGLKGKEADNG